MGYFAKIVNNVVTQVVVADSASDCGSGTWIETKMDGSIRKQYAGVGDTYDSSNDVFIRPKPFDSWTLDGSYNWNPPTAIPGDWNPGTKDYQWNESTRQWEEP
tara:strand:+ start:679 stop:987 length:309 start_codon:yes stop_codon:yes gene_type:complete